LERSGFAEAIATTQSCDAVVLVLGGSSAPDAETGFLENGAARMDEVRESSDFDKDSGEGYDRAKLGLAGLQLELLRELKATGKPVIVVLIQGRPLILNEVIKVADAVLMAWYPGMEGGRAVAEALFGDLNPGGKLPISLPADVGQLPVYYNSTSKRDNYVDCPAEPLLPFGYGLSYTQFSFSDLQIEPAAIPTDGETIVSITVTNEGKLRGDEVVQLYVKDVFASLARPLKELKEFKRISLNPGEYQRVEFRLNNQVLGFWTAHGEFVVEPGEFEIGVGGNPRELMTAPLHLLR
jgi:beta-glucosidase